MEVVKTVVVEVVVEPTAEPIIIEADYQCPDLGSVRLQLGMTAQVNYEKVNLRSSPEVPSDWDANILTALSNGEKVTIIGGPECVYDGTWWEVETESGYIGWMRELTTDSRLLEPLN